MVDGQTALPLLKGTGVGGVDRVTVVGLGDTHGPRKTPWFPRRIDPNGVLLSELDLRHVFLSDLFPIGVRKEDTKRVGKPSISDSCPCARQRYRTSSRLLNKNVVGTLQTPVKRKCQCVVWCIVLLYVGRGRKSIKLFYSIRILVSSFLIPGTSEVASTSGLLFPISLL